MVSKAEIAETILEDCREDMMGGKMQQVNNYLLAIALFRDQTYVTVGTVMDSVQTGQSSLSPFWEDTKQGVFKFHVNMYRDLGYLRTESGKIYPPIWMPGVANGLCNLGVGWGWKGLKILEEYLQTKNLDTTIPEREHKNYTEWWKSLSRRDIYNMRRRWDSKRVRLDPNYLVD